MLQEVQRERVSIAATLLFALVIALSVLAINPAMQSNFSRSMSYQEMAELEGSGPVSTWVSAGALVTGLTIVAVGVACIANPAVGVIVMSVLFSTSTAAGATTAAVGFTVFGGVTATAGYMGLQYRDYLP